MTTETKNQASLKIDTLSTHDMLTLINTEDKKVALAVETVLPRITEAVDTIVNAFDQAGRLVYCGAGTSGRLGILDACDCPPTFGTPPEQIQGIISGGREAVFDAALDKAEDDRQMGVNDLENIEFGGNDVLVGIGASGRTPYVLGAMEHAASTGADVICITCAPQSDMARLADIAITPQVGAEILTGSSRMKAGTAQKMVLNMLSTGAMIRTGKVFGNLMVDVKPANEKLVERQKGIIMTAAGCSQKQATKALNACDGNCKAAIVMLLANIDATAAMFLLKKNSGFIRKAIACSRQG